MGHLQPDRPTPGVIPHRPPAASGSAPWLVPVLLACAALALAGGLLHRPVLSIVAALLLLLAWVPSVWRRRSAAAWSGWMLLAALLLVPALLGRASLALMALPVVFMAGISWFFARTLRPGAEPLITRFVRVTEGAAQLDLPGVRAYTRGVTWFWAGLLAAMALLSLAIALFALPGGWLAAFGLRPPWVLPGSLLAWYPEAGCWMVLLAAFVGEYLFRRWYLRAVPQPGARRFAAALLRQWPALLRDSDATR